MKKWTWLVLICAAAVSLVWAVQNHGLNPLYDRFSGGPYSLKISFDYPHGWRMRMEGGKVESFTQTVFLGPRNAADTYTHTFVVRETPSAAGTLEQLKKKKIDHLYKDARVLSESRTTVDRGPAEEVVASYKIPPLALAGRKPLAVEIKSRMIFIQKGASIFELIYSADSGEFDANAKTFEHLIKSFRFSS